MCSTNKPNISQLVEPSIRTASIVGKDGLNNNKSMALEFFKERRDVEQTRPAVDDAERVEP